MDGAERPERPALPDAFHRRYQLGKRIGRGAMGTVFEAVAVDSGQPVAIKLLEVQQPDYRARFLREAKVLSAIQSPNVVVLHDLDVAGERPYIVMELLEGGSLRQKLDTDGRLPEATAIGLGRCMAAGLAVCHAAGVVHRDLKPDNVMFDRQGRPKLVDLGLAMVQDQTRDLTGTGCLVGTPRYLAPEQTMGHEASPASDLHAMGVVLFEMIVGRIPFQAETVAELLREILMTVPERLDALVPGTRPQLADLVARLLAKNPQGRPDRAALVEGELAELVRLSSSVSRRGAGRRSGEGPVSRAGLTRTSSVGGRDERARHCETIPVRVSAPGRWRPRWEAARPALAGLVIVGMAALGLVATRASLEPPGPASRPVVATTSVPAPSPAKPSMDGLPLIQRQLESPQIPLLLAQLPLVTREASRQVRVSLQSGDLYRRARALRKSGGDVPGAVETADRLRTFVKESWKDILDVDRLIPLLPHARGPGGALERHRKTLVRLALVDALGEASVGKPLLGVLAGLGVEPTVSTTAPIWPGALRPIEGLRDKTLREFRLFPILPVLNSWPRSYVDSPDDTEVDHLAGVMIGLAMGRAAARRTPRHAVGSLPGRLRPQDGLRLHVRVAGLPPDSVLMVRIGATQILAVPGRLRHFVDFQHVTPESPQRARQVSVSHVVNVPPGWLTATDHDLSVALETLDRSATSLVRMCWLVDFEVAAAR